MVSVRPVGIKEDRVYIFIGYLKKIASNPSQNTEGKVTIQERKQ